MSHSGFYLSQIWIYPVKSLGGIRLSSSKVLPKGLEFDRRFMLVDESGTAMTQRQHPRMALFRTSVDAGLLSLSFEGEEKAFPLLPETSEEVKATIWNDKVTVLEVDSSLSKWFSSKLNTTCRLVFFPEENSRPVESPYQLNNEHVSLADAYPLLVIGQASLNDLNSRLDTPVPMNRFRPNLVFDGGPAYSEDGWTEFSIGDSRFAVVKPCARCVLTTVNQETGIKGTEPLKTLASYRTQNNKTMFGQNVLVLNASILREGEQIHASVREAQTIG